VAAQIGIASGQITRTTGAALLAAGLLSAALFPAMSLKLLSAPATGVPHRDPERSEESGAVAKTAEPQLQLASASTQEPG